MLNYGLTKMERLALAWKRPPAWTSAEIAIVRKMAANGESCKSVADALGGKCQPNTVRSRAAKLGIKFHGISRAHYGIQTTEGH